MIGQLDPGSYLEELRFFCFTSRPKGVGAIQVEEADREGPFGVHPQPH